MFLLREQSLNSGSENRSLFYLVTRTDVISSPRSDSGNDSNLNGESDDRDDNNPSDPLLALIPLVVVTIIRFTAEIRVVAVVESRGGDHIRACRRDRQEIDGRRGLTCDS